MTKKCVVFFIYILLYNMTENV